MGKMSAVIERVVSSEKDRGSGKRSNAEWKVDTKLT